ncbi:MAG: Mfa1 family fimbria major subunit [Porphyromonas sp.]|nr:Mfa1 family fimbria major subunit [Porphyromonas sp.]
MNKLHIFTASLLIAHCFSSCTDPRETDQPVGDGRTPMRFEVHVRADGAPARAINDSQATDSGTAGEGNVTSMTVLFSNMLPVTYTTSSGLTWSAQDPTVAMSPVFEVSDRDASGMRLSTLLNGEGFDLKQFDVQQNKTVKLSDFGKLVDTIDGIGKYKNFLMSATAQADSNNIVLSKGATYEEVEAGQKNNFSLNVERLLSKLQVSKAATIKKEGIMTEGTLGDGFTYALAGSAKEAYLFRDYAGKNIGMDRETAEYAGKTFVDAEVVPPTWKGTDVHPFLQRVSDYNGKTTDVANNFAAKPVIVPSENNVPQPIYFLENSTNQEVTGRGQLEYNRIAYIKVYGTFIPNSGLKYGYYDKLWQFIEETEFPARKYSFTVATAEESRPDLTGPERYELDQERYREWSEKYGTEEDLSKDDDVWVTWPGSYLTVNVKDPAGTFYYGEKTGKIYLNFTSALNDGNWGYTRRYVGGKMVWLAPVNAQIAGQGDDRYVKNADTRRNNIYDLTITGFSRLGLPYDPMDPTDPIIPEPENPFAPEPDDHMPVDPLKKAIDVRARVLKWNYIFRSYDLKEPSETIQP